MSGHNKWKQIKERKSKTDGQKSKAFSRYAKLITVEAKKAGGNRDAAGLKAAITRAKAENMPNENIERAIKKATESGAAAMESIMYEAYGPGGVAIIIEALTDNRNKASQEIKIALGKHDIAMASPGSALWAFKKENNTISPASTVSLSDEDIVALEKIVDELENCEEVQEVVTNAE